MITNTNIDIKTQSTTNDGSGSFSNTFVLAYSDVLAMIQPVEDKEKIKAGRKVSDVIYKMYLMHNQTITAKDIVVYDNADYEIVSLLSYPNIYKKLIIVKV